jgi:uncharacterized phosphosugar-binding protein
MLTAGKVYFNKAIQTIEKVMETQSDALEQASDWITDTIKSGGVLHVFGSGHSHAISEDVFWRAGGLAPVNAILDINLTQIGGGSPTRSTRLERLEGYARIVLDNYDLRPGEVIIIVSQSGINPGPIEIAMAAKSMGLKVIALTSLEQSSHIPSRHSSGKHLYEIADLVIDNCVLPGDACVEIAPGLPKAAPLSTVVCCSILQSLVAETATRLYQQGIEPPIWTSANVPGGDERLAQLMTQFGGSRLKTR